MSSNSLQQINPVPAAEPETSGSTPMLRRRLLHISERRRSADKVIEELLSSAMLASDATLRRILLEVDSITRDLKSKDMDGEALKVAHHPAVWSAMKHALLDRELRHLALTDDLTSLYNRRGFFAAGTQLLKLARRKGHPVLLFYCDLDDLKRINDSWGHHEGDLALVRAAEALEKTFRDSDVVARIGGDEFAVVSMEALTQGEQAIVQRLNKNLKKYSKDESRYTLSLSIGVACSNPKASLSLADLMLDADRAMYERKRQRRCSTLVSTRQLTDAIA